MAGAHTMCGSSEGMMSASTGPPSLEEARIWRSLASLGSAGGATSAGGAAAAGAAAWAMAASARRRAGSGEGAAGSARGARAKLCARQQQWEDQTVAEVGRRPCQCAQRSKGCSALPTWSGAGAAEEKRHRRRPQAADRHTVDSVEAVCIERARADVSTPDGP